VERALGWPCGVCGGGIGGDLMRCADCRRWVHGECGGIRGGVCRVKTFV